MELAVYQLKDAENQWYTEWENSKASDAELSEWGEFVEAFLDELVGNMRTHMSKFASGLSNNFVLEYKGAMLNRDMDFSIFFVHMQQVEEKKKRVVGARENYKQAKRSRPRVKGTLSQGSVSQLARSYPRCYSYRKYHPTKYQLGRLVCYAYGQPSLIQGDCPSDRRYFGGSKSQPNSSAPLPPPKGTTSVIGGRPQQIYALSSCQDIEASPNMVTGYEMAPEEKNPKPTKEEQ
ncbi:uncharacterized protein LOC124888779 [Capsicum annuum]|uniref:uncharacterized protein LOC124888779 n=1 Tax=Capsicum annuum TaxID=4072 RepID=UPI001FB09181|nr:uncharacterized protein LOC124888779 [Capsicum annuum]